MEFADNWGLVTGASSGIGAEFARQLAARRMHLVLVARRAHRLESLAEELRTAHSIQTRVVPLDLTQEGAAQQLLERVEAEESPVELLVNNAGIGGYGSLESMSPEQLTTMIRLNVEVLTELTRRFLEPMLERRAGAILNVASSSAYQPVAYMAAYSATKAYVLHFTEAVWAEARKRGVSVTALCPGFIETEFFDQAGLPKSAGLLMQPVEKIVAAGIDAIGRNRPSLVPDWMNFFVSLMPRLVTRRLTVTRSQRLFNPRKHR